MNELLAVITITVFAVISPGPDFAMVTRNSLMLSRRAGILTAIGIALLIHQSLWLFNLIKLAGAIYLILLGVKMLRAVPGENTAERSITPLSNFAALRTGFLTNVLNPKTTLFIVSLFMQVVNPETPLAVQLGYGLFISLTHLLWFSLVALCFSIGMLREGLLAARHWIDRTFGGLLIVFGIALALMKRS